MTKAELGNPLLQQRMRASLRKLAAKAVRMEPESLFILIGIPPDGAPRVSHNLQDAGDAYRVMEHLVETFKEGSVHYKAPDSGSDA